MFCHFSVLRAFPLFVITLGQFVSSASYSMDDLNPLSSPPSSSLFTDDDEFSTAETPLPNRCAAVVAS